MEEQQECLNLETGECIKSLVVESFPTWELTRLISLIGYSTNTLNQSLLRVELITTPASFLTISLQAK